VLEMLRQPAEIAEQTARRHKEVDGLPVLRESHHPSHDAIGITLIGEKVGPLHVLHSDGKPRAYEKRTREETCDRANWVGRQVLKVKIGSCAREYMKVESRMKRAAALNLTAAPHIACSPTSSVLSSFGFTN